MEYYCLYPDDPVGVYWILAENLDDDAPILLRKEYRHLRCGNCGKVDEEAAVKEFLSADIRISSKRDAGKDILSTCDDFILISRRFEDVMRKERITGAKLYKLPNEPRFNLLVPRRIPGRFAASSLEARTPPAGQCYGAWWVEETPARDLSTIRQAVTRALCRKPKRPLPVEELFKIALSGRKPLPGRSTKAGRCTVCKRHFATYGFVDPASLELPKNPRALFSPSFNHESTRGNRFELLCSEVLANLLVKHRLKGMHLSKLRTK
jgi:hypothetical protein